MFINTQFPIMQAVVLAIALAMFGANHPTSLATNQVTQYGTLDNFDVINDTGGECHGFEIELEGISAADVAYTFGAPYQRYGDPTIVPNPANTGVIIRYAAAYDSSTHAWSAATPIAVQPYLPTQGHSCWTGGVANPAEYYAAGCDHFGASLNATPTKTTYRWLVENASSPGTLTPFGSNASLPAPVWNVTPPPSPAQQPIAAAIIAPPDVDPASPYDFGEALWVKVYTTELPNGLHAEDLDHMVIDDPNVDIVPNEPVEIEFEWMLLQAEKGVNRELVFGDQAEVGAGSEAVSRRFEFYKYTGQYDPENHEATCDNPTEPGQQTPDRCGDPDASGVAGVGDLIGAQNVAINLAGVVLPENHPAIAKPDTAVTDEDVAVTISKATLLGNDDPGDVAALTVLSVQDAINGMVAIVGADVIFTPDLNFNGAASFTYTIDDGHGGTSTAMVDVNVTPVNDPPVANPNTGVTPEDTSLTMTPAMLLGDDTDVEGDMLTLASVQAPINGTVGLDGGNAVFTPLLNFNGAASFTYTIDDGHGGTSTAKVDVNVTPVNDPPVANAGPDQPDVIWHDTVLLNASLSYDVDGDSLTYQWSFVSVPPKSKATFSGGGTANPTFKADKEGTYVVRLVLNDGMADSAPDEVTIIATKGKK